MGRIFYNGNLYSGNASHNYSTDEQIVGTWIDGSTVYEKVWDFGSNIAVSYNGWTSTPIPNSGYEMILSTLGISTTGSFVGEVLVNKVDTDYIQLQTSKNNSDIYIRYVIVRYIKSST